MEKNVEEIKRKEEHSEYIIIHVIYTRHSFAWGGETHHTAVAYNTEHGKINKNRYDDRCLT